MKIQEKIEATIKTEEIQDVSIDVAESIVDIALDDGVLRDIPLIGSIVGLSKGYFTIKDRLLTKKLLFFLLELQSIPMKERISQLEKINNSEKYESNVGDKLLFVIDKAEDSRIASLIGKLFRLNILEKMSYNNFIRCTQIINSSNIDLTKYDCIELLINKLELNGISEVNFSQYLLELDRLNLSQIQILKWVVENQNVSSNNLNLSDFYELLMQKSCIEMSEEVVMFKSNIFQMGFRNLLDPTSGLDSNPDFPTSLHPTEYAHQLYKAFSLNEIEKIDISEVDRILRRK